MYLKLHSPQQELKQVESEKICRVVSSKNCNKAELKTSLSKSTTETNMGQGDFGSCAAKYILCMFNFVFFVSLNQLLIKIW